MTATDYSILDDLAADPGAINARKMAIIYGAILDAAAIAGGTLTAASIRPHLPAHLTDDPRVGAAVSALIRRGIIRRTGRYALSGNGKSRNSNRPVPVYRVLDWAALEARAA